MSCRGADFGRAIEHARRQIAKYAKVKGDSPRYYGQLRSAQIALEALLLIRQHAMEGVVLGRVDQLRAERPCGGTEVQGPECAKCSRRCGIVYG